MKPLRWTSHALAALVDRDVDQAEVEQTIAAPELSVIDPPLRGIPMRRYFADREVSEEDIAMKVTDDRETDSLIITLRDAPIRESDEVRPGVIADFGEEGGVVRFEILRALRVVEDAERVQFATTG